MAGVLIGARRCRDGGPHAPKPRRRCGVMPLASGAEQWLDARARPLDPGHARIRLVLASPSTPTTGIDRLLLQDFLPRDTRPHRPHGRTHQRRIAEPDDRSSVTIGASGKPSSRRRRSSGLHSREAFRRVAGRRACCSTASSPPPGSSRLGQLVPPHRRRSGPEEMRIIFMGTAPFIRPGQMNTSIFVQLGNGQNFVFDLGEGAIANYIAARLRAQRARQGLHHTPARRPLRLSPLRR